MNASAVLESDREQALGAIIAAYNQVTDRLKEAHERLQHEVRRLREELERKNEELRRSERLAALGEMAAGLAHEVRNPLGGIGLQAAMLEREFADRPRAAQGAQRIREGVRTLDRLVTEVLSFAQEGTLEPSMIALRPIVRRVTEMARPGDDATGPRMVIDVAAERVWADAERLERALLNLVRNAAEAAGLAGVVRLMTRTAGGGVEIEVADDGPGIAPEHLERIFNPFFTTKASGTGLGLAIVHRIVEAHGGRIRATSEPGAGARFVVWLPGRAVASG